MPLGLTAEQLLKLVQVGPGQQPSPAPLFYFRLAQQLVLVRAQRGPAWRSVAGCSCPARSGLICSPLRKKK